jgi:hypothetical protein
MVPEDFEWMAQRNCRGKPTAMWFPARGDALTDKPAPVGIWAGTDERERAAIRRERRAPRTNSASPLAARRRG